MNPSLLRNGIVCLAILLLPAAAWATADTTPPALVSIAFAPSAVDVSSTTQTVSVTAEATDNNSGVGSVYCYFRSPSGANSLAFYMDSYDLVSGNPLDGVYSTTELMSSCVEAGTWTLESATVTDQCGNSVSYAPTASGSTLAFPAGTALTLTVTNTSTPPPTPPGPVVTGFTFTPSAVDLSTTIPTVTVTITGSNISSADYAFVSPSGNHSAYGSLSGSGPGISGTFSGGLYDFTSCDEPGAWKIQYIYVYDSSGLACASSTTASFSSTKLPPGTPVTSITVTNPNANTTPPALVSLALSSTTADVSNGPATILATVGASSNSSGVNSGYGTYTGTSGLLLELSFYNNTGTVVVNGTFPGNIPLNTCTLPGIYKLTSLNVFDECGNVAQYGTSGAAFPAGILPSSILVTNGTSSFGSVGVEIYPGLAGDFGASWYLDSGSNNTQFSGEPVTGVAPGPHTITYTDATGYTTPATQDILVAANATTWVSGTYVSTTPSDAVQVTILPAGAVAAGAQWNVDYGPLQASGATVSGLADGSHTIEFSEVDGFTAPPSQTVTTASNLTTVTTGTYAVVTGSGSLTVTLTPAGAIKAGAQWNVDGGSSESSGATVPGLVAGGHTVNFLGGGTAYSAPAAQSVLINANQTTSATGTYTALSTGTGSLTVTITPSTAVSAGAEWNLDGGASQKSGSTLTAISASNYTLNFTMVPGYITPASQSVTIVPDETLVASGTYAKAPPVTFVAETFAGISPNGKALLTLDLKDNGKFTGKFLTASAGSYTLGGTFPSTGYFAGTAGKKPPVPYILQVTGSSPSTYLLTGSANGVQLTAYPAAYAKGQTASEEGKYTALFTGTNPSIAIPQGTGYATLTVSKTGAGTITGKLADGTGFSASSLLVAGSSGNELIVYDPNLYGKKGLLSGVLFFDAPAVGEFDGTLSWQKPPQSGSYYPAGFGATLNVAGALYDKAMQVPFSSGTLTFSGGGLGGAVTQPFTVTGAGVVTLTAPITDDAKLAIKTSTGVVSGSVKPDGKEIKFKGLLLQDPNDPRAAGYFLGPVVGGTGLSGNVTLP